MNDYYSPIPINQSVNGWKNVTIYENNEPLIPLNDYNNKYLTVSPQYYLQQIPDSIDILYCRENVAKLLVNAAKCLPRGYKYLIFDAWRPVNVQLYIYKKYESELKSKGYLGNELEKLVETYVSLPSNHIKKPSPHLTGGSIDISILNELNVELNMGTKFDYFGIEAKTAFYENKNNRSSLEDIYLKNRRLLYNSLIRVGFTNYPDEWWHYDYGNQFWAIQLNRFAIYNKSSVK